jgi:hypothetical protein
MKKAVTYTFFIIASIQLAYTQVKVIKIEIKGDTYNVCRECLSGFPQDLFGTYKYEGKGEPLVVLNPDFKGQFQTHGMPANDIEFWFDCDSVGNVTKKPWVSGGFQYAMLVHYLKPREGYSSDYDIFEVTTRPDLGEIQVLRERTKPHNPQ